MNYDQRSIAMHKKHQGKIGVRSLVPLEKTSDLSLAYTPGVGAVSLAIASDKRLARTLTMKGRTVAVVSDGTAILGLGDLGPEAALPVMEGKCALFKEFANVDAFPIVLATKDVDEIVATVKAIAPGFGGINLEDISAPRCFEIEEKLQKELNIPVFHDDQHGTAIVILAALTNALRLTGRTITHTRVVINGAGAAAVAAYHLLIKAGVTRENVIMLDSKGILHPDRGGLRGYKQAIALETNRKSRKGTLADALPGADVFIGTSVAHALRPEWVDLMAEQPIVFALANPEPEISFSDAKRTKIAVFGTGRSDHPNQINNVLAFPGVFRGALDAGATFISEEMKLAAALALAKLISQKELRADRILPDPFDPRVVTAVAKAVRAAARKR